MTGGLTLSSFGLIWLTLIVLSFGQVLIKMGVGKEKIPVSKNPVRMALNVLARVVRPKTLAGFFLYVVGTFIWLMVLSRVSLSVAFPLFSMSYFLVVILSATILHERVVWRYAIAGLVLISIGVTFIGLSSPPKGSCDSTQTRRSGRFDAPQPNGKIGGNARIVTIRPKNRYAGGRRDVSLSHIASDYETRWKAQHH